MFESRMTGEWGNFSYILCHLIVRGEHGLILNLRWSRYVYEEYYGYGEWVYEPLWKSVVKFIKTHKFARFALALAAICNAPIWFNILNII